MTNSRIDSFENSNFVIFFINIGGNQLRIIAFDEKSEKCGEHVREMFITIMEFDFKSQVILSTNKMKNM